MRTRLILVLCLVAARLVAQQALFPQPPGLQTYTFRESMKKNVEATLDTIKALGFKEVECGAFPGKTIAESRRLLDERGIRCTSFGAGYDDLLNKTDEVGANAKAMGAEYVMLAWILRKAPFTLEDAKEAAVNFNRIGKHLKEKYGLTFCYHNHGYEFQPYENGTLFDYIVQHTDPKYVSFEMDILWTIFPGQDAAALLNKYGSRFKLMHLKDLRKGVKGDLSGGTPVTNDVTLGEGQAKLPEILRAAHKAGIRHYYIEDESPVYYRQVPQSLSYLKTLTR
ncbi:MAG: sugar phosphate isomerase/epimerase [Siphonobacter aquaeclarae]|nr:sugar phosphate isomerase/epimerase [Siphonobacter aquaeclarae]